ncbi:hypothetical protein GJ496_010110 [Pomphorhynchus laevis]|nr:hypothetical protein GJ496_010110 [Pomphorhynchus laevis]
MNASDNKDNISRNRSSSKSVEDNSSVPSDNKEYLIFVKSVGSNEAVIDPQINTENFEHKKSQMSQEIPSQLQRLSSQTLQSVTTKSSSKLSLLSPQQNTQGNIEPQQFYIDGNTEEMNRCTKSEDFTLQEHNEWNKKINNKLKTYCSSDNFSGLSSRPVKLPISKQATNSLESYDPEDTIEYRNRVKSNIADEEDKSSLYSSDIVLQSYYNSKLMANKKKQNLIDFRETQSARYIGFTESTTITTPLLEKDSKFQRIFEDERITNYQSSLSYPIISDIPDIVDQSGVTTLSPLLSSNVNRVKEKRLQITSQTSIIHTADPKSGASDGEDDENKCDYVPKISGNDRVSEFKRLYYKKRNLRAPRVSSSCMSLFELFPSETVSDVNRRSYAIINRANHNVLSSKCRVGNRHGDDFLTLPMPQGYIYVKCNELKSYNNVIFTEDGIDRFYNLKEIVHKISNKHFFDEAEASVVNYWLKLISDERQRKESNSMSTNAMLGIFVLVGAILCTLLISLIFQVLPAITIIIKKK